MKTKLILTFLFISIFVHSQDIRVDLDTLTMDDYLYYRFIPDVGITMDIIVKSGKEYIEWCEDNPLMEVSREEHNGMVIWVDSAYNHPTFEGYIKWFDELLKEER